MPTDAIGLAGGMLKFSASQATALLLGAATQVLLARWLGANDFGVFSIAVTVATVMSFVVPLGLPITVTRFLPEYTATSDWARARGLIRSCLRLTLAGSVISMILIGGIVSLARVSVLERNALYLGLLLLPVFALENMIAALLQAEKRWSASFLPPAVLAPVAFFASALIMELVLHDLTILHLLIAMLIANTLAMLVQVWLFFGRDYQKYAVQHATDETRTWLSASMPVLLMTIFVVVLARADLLVIGASADRKDVGVYAAVLTLALLLELFGDAADAVASPDMAVLYHSKDMGRLQKLMSAVARASFYPTVLGYLGFVFFGKQLLDIFGPGFDVGYNALLILGFAEVIKSASGAPGYLLIMSGYQNRMGMVYGVMVLIDIPLLIVLTRMYGINGAAAATTLTVLASRLMLNWQACRDTHLRSSIFTHGR